MKYCTYIKSFDFSTLYTTIPHQKLKSRLASIIRNSFLHKKRKSEIQIFGFRSRGTLYCEGTLWFEEQVHWRRHHQDARVSSWQHFRGLRGKGFPTDSRHSHGHKLCPSPSRLFLYSHEAEFIQSLLSAGNKRLAFQFNFTCRYIDDVLSINNPDVENYLGQMYPPELEIKDTTEGNTSASYLDLLLSIVLQTFRSWVATSHLRPSMAFLSHNSSDTPELTPLMNVLFWGWCDFPISFSGMEMWRNFWNRL